MIHCSRCGTVLVTQENPICGGCLSGALVFGQVGNASDHSTWSDGNRAMCDFIHRNKIRPYDWSAELAERERIEAARREYYGDVE